MALRSQLRKARASLRHHSRSARFEQLEHRWLLAIDFTVVETLNLPEAAARLLAIRDMDGDGVLDVVARTSSSGTPVKVFERSGSTFVARFSAPSSRGGIVADVDGDGRAEIAAANGVSPSTLTLYESTGDNAYAQIYSVNDFHSAIDGDPVFGDSDDDGRLEYLVPQESSPARARTFEANGDNSFTEIPGLAQGSGDAGLAGVADLDGDGLSEVVFNARGGSTSNYTTSVFEHGTLIFQNSPGIAARVGDTDGNGLQEIIYREGGSVVSLLFFESDGMNGFTQVADVDFFDDPITLFYVDVLGNGTLNVVSATGTNSNIMTIMHRVGAALGTDWTSDLLFQSSLQPITSVIRVEDTNNDGLPELAVLQGNQVHLLQQEQTANEPPIVSLSGATSADEGDTHSYSFTTVDPGESAFSLVTQSCGGNGVLSNATFDSTTGTGSFDCTFPDGPAISEVSVQVADSEAANSNLETLDVTVANVAPELEDAQFTVVENSANGTLIGIVTGVDPGDDLLTYAIVGGSGATVFGIDMHTGQITVTDSHQLDFETIMMFTLDVDVTDEDGDNAIATVTIDLLNQASISGVVFVDVNQNDLYEANEPGIDGVIIELLDELGNPVLDESLAPLTATTGNGGFYLFEDLDPGTYRLHEIQPTGVGDGAEILGSLGGSIPANDTMQLALERVDAVDYVFAEIGQTVTSGDTATIGFWQNRHGQQLIDQGGTALANWLATSFSNIFGNVFASTTVADFYKQQLFKQTGKKSGPAKVDAQFMAVALATFFTSRHLAGEVAAVYGFNVTDTGIAARVVNVGTRGAAFGVANGTDRTIMQLLQATNDLTDAPDQISSFASIYDLNGDGVIDSDESALRAMANDVYASINELGDI